MKKLLIVLTLLSSTSLKPAALLGNCTRGLASGVSFGISMLLATKALEHQHNGDPTRAVVMGVPALLNYKCGNFFLLDFHTIKKSRISLPPVYAAGMVAATLVGPAIDHLVNRHSK